MSGLHPIQLKIIALLEKLGTANFNKIKPEHIDPKLFVYHLDKLIEGGMLEKTREGLYQFTGVGRHALVGLHTGAGFYDAAVNAYVLILLRWQDKILVVMRTRVPFLEYVGILSMAIDRSLPIVAGVEDFLRRNVIQARQLRLTQLLDVLYKSSVSGEVVQHSLMYVVAGELESDSFPAEIEEGKLSLMTEQELLAVEKGYSNTKDVLAVKDGDTLQYITREYTDAL